MRGTTDIGIRGAAISLLLIAATACTTPGDGDGNGGVDGDAAPSVSISAPADGATFASGATISFSGSANDAEDGDITADLDWTSNLDGAIGTGGDVTATLSDGTHAIAASVTDSAGQSASASVTVTVGEGGGGGGGGSSGIRDVGFVAVEELEDDFLTTVDVSGSGGFVRFDADVPGAFFSDPWGELVGTCEVTTITVPDPFEGLPIPDIGLTSLEAGTSLDVTSSGASYLELDRFETTFDGDTLVAYATTSAVAGPLAASLAVDVPGDEFPAVTSATFPDVAAIDLTTPADPGAAGSVDVDTTFAWSGASGDADTVVTIDFSSAAGTTFVTCYAADTGSFALPDATKTELGAAFSGSVDQAARESIRVEPVGDARLLLSVSRARSFAAPFVFPLPIRDQR